MFSAMTLPRFEGADETPKIATLRGKKNFFIYPP